MQIGRVEYVDEPVCERILSTETGYSTKTAPILPRIFGLAFSSSTSTSTSNDGVMDSPFCCCDRADLAGRYLAGAHRSVGLDADGFGTICSRRNERDVVSARRQLQAQRSGS